MNKQYLYNYLSILAGYCDLLLCTFPLGWLFSSDFLWLYNLIIFVAALDLTGRLAVQCLSNSTIGTWLKLVWLSTVLAFIPGLVIVSIAFYLIAIEEYKTAALTIGGPFIFSSLLLIYSCLTSLLGVGVRLYFRYKKPVPGLL